MTTPARERTPLARVGADQGTSRSKANDTTLAAALRYAENGFPVLPVHMVRVASLEAGEAVTRYEKRPLISKWYESASTNPNTLKYWFAQQWPYANIGMVTGYRSGRVVIDVDPRNGGNETLAKLPELPETLTHSTVSGGWHFIFRHNGPLQSCVLGPGIDLKADHGFIVVPPTPGYEVVLDTEPLDFQSWLAGISAAQGGDGFVRVHSEVSGQSNTAQCASPLCGRVTTPTTPTTPEPTIRTVDNPETYLRATFSYCITDVGTAQRGSRNGTLYRKAYYLAGLVAGGHLEESDVRDVLTDAALEVGLGIDEIMATIDSAFKAGVQRPISLQRTEIGRAG